MKVFSFGLHLYKPHYKTYQSLLSLQKKYKTFNFTLPFYQCRYIPLNINLNHEIVSDFMTEIWIQQAIEAIILGVFDSENEIQFN